MTSTPTNMTFVAQTVHKRDVFSETIAGHLAEDPDFDVVLRRLSGVPWYARPISSLLARREIRALRKLEGVEGTPRLLRVDREGLLRSWSHGTPLQLAQPNSREWYLDAKRLLRQMHRRGVTHNDSAKPQNWLVRPDGGAALIDYQLATVHRRRSKIFKIKAREDLRHLLKQKRSFAPELLLPSEKKMLAQKSLPSRIWMATGKKLYNFITRRLMNWSDGEGIDHRLEHDGPAIHAALSPAGEVALCTYKMPAGGIGIYAFVETVSSAEELRRMVPKRQVELVQPVGRLPRLSNGQVDMELLQLIAANKVDDLTTRLDEDAELARIVGPIADARLNFTDRVLS